MFLDLRLALYCLFGTYGTGPSATMLNIGPVLDVVCTKSGGMRGQAHIVFRDVVTATTAMRALQNFMFLDKEMVSLPSTFSENCGLIGFSISHTPRGKVILLRSLTGRFVFVYRKINQEAQNGVGKMMMMRIATRNQSDVICGYRYC